MRKSMSKKLKVLLSLLTTSVLAFQSIPAFPAKAAVTPTSNLTVTSDNAFLQRSFLNAKNYALGDVRTYTTPSNMPCYFAAMSDDHFCARDVTHYMAGAHLLGLDNENFSMEKLFAWGANHRVAPKSSDPYWVRWHYPYSSQINADGTGVMDGSGTLYDNLTSCEWRTLPTDFDMAWRDYEQYLWTGDKKWINDTEMFNFYTNVQTNFLQNQNYYNYTNNEVATETMCFGSYYEFPNPDQVFVSSGDSIGTQYQSLLSYSNVLKARGDSAGAKTYKDKADHLRSIFETYWYDNNSNRYISGISKLGAVNSNWCHEASIFIPMTLISDQGPRTDAYLDFIDESTKAMAAANNPLNHEAITYFPEMFYKYGRNEQAWDYLKNRTMTEINGADPTHPSNLYPELPFTVVSDVVSGMMGVTPDAPNNTVSTIPRLPVNGLPNDNQSVVTWLQADHIPVGGNDLTIRHDRNTQTTLTNNSGNTITWNAEFYGNYSQLNVNGTAKTATITTLNGKTISYVQVTVPQGQTIVVNILGNKGADLTPPSSPLLPVPAPPAAPSAGIHYLSDMNSNLVYAASDNHTVQYNKSVSGSPLVINGSVPYLKGIGTYAESAIKYNLYKQYSRFKCDIGFQDSSQTAGSAEFIIYGGMFNSSTLTKLYDSGTVNRGDAVKKIDIDLSNFDNIMLAVKRAAGVNTTDGDEVDWANARLVVGNDTQAPTAPSSLTYSNLYPDSINLSWTASSDNVGVKNYNIYDGSALLCTTTSTSCSLTSLTPSTTYNFTVTAKDACENESAASNIVVITTPQIVYKYLSDLSWTSATSGYGSVQKDKTINGNTITLSGKSYPKGIGTHAASDIIYDLASSPHLKFQAMVGLDDEVPLPSVDSRASVEFQVIDRTIDPNTNLPKNTVLFDSGRMIRSDAAKAVDVNVAGVKTLLLRVINTNTDGGITWDHADWADAKFNDYVPQNQLSWDYISDLSWTSATTGWGTIQKDKNIDGGVLSLNGKTYSKGIGTHAVSNIVYTLGGQYQSFHSIVGLDDAVGTNGAVEFQVFADNNPTPLFSSGTMKGGDAAQTIDVSVKGVNTLTLKVINKNSDGTINWDHGDWVDARLSK